jgi:hypothetical protein
VAIGLGSDHDQRVRPSSFCRERRRPLETAFTSLGTVIWMLKLA